MSEAHNKIIYDLERCLPKAKARIKSNELMKHHTSFKIGGLADIFVEPVSIKEIITVKKYCRENNIACTIIGRGSNILVSDLGIRGVVISISDLFSGMKILDSDGYKRKVTSADDQEKVRLRINAGTRLSALASFAANNSLTGLEFASGIPGTLGGAVIMNAGAYDGCMSDVVVQTRYLNTNCEIISINKQAHTFAYRSSCFMSQPESIILCSYIELRYASKDMIFAKTADYTSRRRSTQPLDLPSAGSAFKRPTGNYAGKLITDNGLKGLRIGDAQVSLKHAGFIVNLGDATAHDVKALIMEVKRIVRNNSGIDLVPEVRFIGEWQEE